MTIDQTIITAEEYANRDRADVACKMLRAKIATAKRGKDQFRLEAAMFRILDAAVDATVARSQRTA